MKITLTERIKKPFAVIMLLICVLVMLSACGASWADDEDTALSSRAAVITTSKKQETESTSAVTTTTAKQTSSKEETATVTEEKKEYVEYWFRTKKLRDSHYEKHGIEMGFASADEYRKAASDVINNPDALTKIEKEDGDTCYYIEATDEFVVLSTDGYIRTYFNPGGKDYFDRQ